MSAADGAAAAPDSAPLLEVSGLNAYYGRAHALQDVSFQMGQEPVSLIGRNGMGKSTLCNAIMSIRPPTVKGSIRFAGQELAGKPSYKIGGAGIGYVPQGRRLFESLTVDEHLRMIAPGEGINGGRPTPSTSCSRGWLSGAATAARNSRAASSRCSRSDARC